MARNPKPSKKQDRRPRPSAAGGGRPRRGRPKFCIFCSERATWVDYKDTDVLKRFTNDRGRIKARGATGTCAQHQRDVASAIKNARELALLPYAVRTTGSESRGGRGGGRRPNDGPRAAEGASDAEGVAPSAEGVTEADEADGTSSVDGLDAPEDADGLTA